MTPLSPYAQQVLRNLYLWDQPQDAPETVKVTFVPRQRGRSLTLKVYVQERSILHALPLRALFLRWRVGDHVRVGGRVVPLRLYDRQERGIGSFEEDVQRHLSRDPELCLPWQELRAHALPGERTMQRFTMPTVKVTASLADDLRHLYALPGTSYLLHLYEHGDGFAHRVLDHSLRVLKPDHGGIIDLLEEWVGSPSLIPDSSGSLVKLTPRTLQDAPPEALRVHLQPSLPELRDLWDTHTVGATARCARQILLPLHIHLP